MFSKKIFKVTIISMLLLGCEGNGDAMAKDTVKVSINPLPVIMNVVAGKVSELNLNDSNTVLNRVCQVAYGEINLSAFKEEVNKSGSDMKKQSKFFQLVQSDDLNSYKTVCAAHIIQSVATIPDVNKYVTQEKNDDGQSVFRTNEKAVIDLMPFRLAVARATAELYARIAASLLEEKALSTEMYNQKINKLFSQAAADYLETVGKYNKEDSNHRYQLLLLRKGRFIFKSDSGYLVDINDNNMNLYSYGTPWLTGGYVLGAIHSIDTIMSRP
ncbi:hypothetical protein RBH39_23800 [Escherichia coli]|uniref:hypothetical protein n=1 Tax=Escherichia coli TaxID=562 RepID=UPI002FC90389